MRRPIAFLATTATLALLANPAEAATFVLSPISFNGFPASIDFDGSLADFNDLSVGGNESSAPIFGFTNDGVTDTGVINDFTVGDIGQTILSFNGDSFVNDTPFVIETTANGGTTLQAFGTFSGGGAFAANPSELVITFQTGPAPTSFSGTVTAVPEPLTIIGSGIALALGAAAKRRLA